MRGDFFKRYFIWDLCDSNLAQLLKEAIFGPQVIGAKAKLQQSPSSNLLLYPPTCYRSHQSEQRRNRQVW
jgi:hypothetical protein